MVESVCKTLTNFVDLVIETDESLPPHKLQTIERNFKVKTVQTDTKIAIYGVDKEAEKAKNAVE